MSYVYLTRVTCDGCGAVAEYTSSKPQSDVKSAWEPPEGWKPAYNKKISLYGANVHTCPDCISRLEAYQAAEKAWKEARAEAAKGQGWGKLLPWVKKNQVQAWDAANPRPLMDAFLKSSAA